MQPQEVVEALLRGEQIMVSCCSYLSFSAYTRASTPISDFELRLRLVPYLLRQSTQSQAL